MRSLGRILLLAVCAFFLTTHAAFEDEYLKETWHRQYLGQPIAVATANNDSLTIVYTKLNTIGAINNNIPFDSFNPATTLDNVVWKHVLPVSEKSLALSVDSRSIVALSSQVHNLTTTSHTALYPKARRLPSTLYNLRVFDYEGALQWHKRFSLPSSLSMLVHAGKVILFSPDTVSIVDIETQSLISQTTVPSEVEILSLVPTTSGISILGKSATSVFQKNLSTTSLSLEKPLDLSLTATETQALPPLTTRFFLKYPHASPSTTPLPVFLAFSSGKLMYLPAYSLGKSAWRSVSLPEAVDVVSGAADSSPFSLITAAEHSSDVVPVPFHITSSPSTGGLTFEPALHIPCTSSTPYLSLSTSLSVSASSLLSSGPSSSSFTLRLHSPFSSSFSTSIAGVDGGPIDCLIAGRMLFVTTAVRSTVALLLPSSLSNPTPSSTSADSTAPLAVSWHRADYLAAASTLQRGLHAPRENRHHTRLVSTTATASGAPTAMAGLNGSATGNGIPSTSSLLFTLSAHCITAINSADGSVLWARYTATHHLLPLHSDARRIPDVDDEIGAEAEAEEEDDVNVLNTAATGAIALPRRRTADKHSGDQGDALGDRQGNLCPENAAQKYIPKPSLAVLGHAVCAAVPFRTSGHDGRPSKRYPASTGMSRSTVNSLCKICEDTDEVTVDANVVTYIACFDHSGADIPIPENNNFPNFQTPDSGTNRLPVPLTALDIITQAFPFATVIPGIIVADTVTIISPSTAATSDLTSKLAPHHRMWVMLSLTAPKTTPVLGVTASTSATGAAATGSTTTATASASVAVMPRAWVVTTAPSAFITSTSTTTSTSSSTAVSTLASQSPFAAVSLSFLWPTTQRLYTYAIDIFSSFLSSSSSLTALSSKSSVVVGQSIITDTHLTLSRPIGGNSAPKSGFLPSFPKIALNSHPEPVNPVRVVANARLLKAASSKHAVIATEHCTPTTTLTESTATSSTTSSTPGPVPVCVPHVLLTVTDLTSGGIVERLVIPHASRPLVAFSEHRVLCSYWDIKALQHRVTVVELLSATSTVGWTGILLNSLGLSAPPTQPEGLYTLQQTYTLPIAPVAMTVTSSSNGLANVDVIIASADGSLWEIPQAYLDARRPMAKEDNADANAEALPLYSTILPLTTHNLLSQNITLEGIRDVWVGPSDKESMSIAVVSGNDWYACSVYTSGKFDTLNDDFSKSFLILTVVAVFGATLFAKYYADRQSVVREWK